MGTTTEQHALPVPAWTLAVTAMFCVQLGSALSLPLIGQVGPAGTAWLRLSAGALIFLALARPPLRDLNRRDIPALIALGVTTGVMTSLFLSAIERIPLGTTVAIEFLGPLSVAAVRSHNRRALVWPAIAGIGVLLLTEPWHGSVNAAGIAFAVGSAFGWAAYIVLTQHVGDRFSGLNGLSLTMPIAAVTAAVVGIPQAHNHITPAVLATAVGLAVLLPVLPFALEMTALRHMTPSAFGTLMALEPAIGVVLGLIVLHQHPAALQVAGVMLVVIAGAGAQRNGKRNGGRQMHPPAEVA
ncbi:MAG TPA: EamA family transporter [Mycobacterium sp.]|uniref:EamA family transporter n=1 Tax=Mycolicibacterium sp. TaxID=2320850 RepID=UPI002600FF9B|nr:EamA family transporter [Mycolicibacterium sp.]HPX36754.1 EamA family transporter [Mycobacterium sp.]HQC76728.1 EamA family transporter [Mycobacterium sp.]